MELELKVVDAEGAAKLGKDQRESAFEFVLKLVDADGAPADFGEDQRESEFELELELKVVSAAVAAKLGTDQRQSEFEPELKVITAEVTGKLLSS